MLADRRLADLIVIDVSDTALNSVRKRLGDRTGLQLIDIDRARYRVLLD